MKTLTKPTSKSQLYLQSHFEEYLLVKGFSTATRATLLRTVNYFARWAKSENIELTNIAYNDVMGYVNYCKGKGNHPRTLQIVVNSLKHYYNFLLEQEQVIDNPCTNIAIRGVKRKVLYDTFTPGELEGILKTFAVSALPSGVGSAMVHKRNRVILSLMIFQGLRTEEIGRLTVKDLDLQQGKIFVAGTLRTNEREMSLEASQVFELMDYVNDTRKMFLNLRGKATDTLFLSLGSSERFNNIMQKLMKSLMKQNSRIKDAKQIRTSVIANWLKVENIRKVQHMAGHRYVSSTEGYQINNLDDLKEDIVRYHPDL